MKILAFDSSGLVASVAIVENNNLIAEYTTNYKKTHSQTLLPMTQNRLSDGQGTCTCMEYTGYCGADT